MLRNVFSTKSIKCLENMLNEDCSISVKSLTATTGDFDTLTVNHLTATTLDFSTITASNLEATTAVIETLDVGTLTADSITATTLDFDTLSVDDLTATTADISTLTASNLAATTAVIDTLDVGTLTADSITATTLDFDTLSVDDLTATTADIGTLTASNLEATTAVIDNLDVNTLTASNLTATTGDFSTLSSSTDPVDANGVGDRGFNDARYLLESNNLSDVVTPATAFTNIKQAATTSVTGVVEIATNAEAAAFTDETKVVTPESLGYVLAGLLASGVEWDEDNSSPTLTRTGALAGIAAAASPGNACLPIHSAMRRCILSDAGEVVYYLGATDSTKKEDGSTASVLDGTDGQVMVEIPKFAFKYSYNAAINVHSWSISSVLLPGYEWHPAFFKDGAWVDHRYIGAYEGIGYDDGTSAYFDGDDAGDTHTQWPGGTGIDVGNDKLGSVSGFAPLMNETRDEFRSIALNRGTGYRQQDFYLVSAIQLLYLVEYASFYSQDVIGMGRTELTGGTWAKDSYIGVTGKSNADGNATANTGGDTNDSYMSYRGIENFYGNVWKWVDGFNVNGNIPYVCNTETDFADGTAAAYTRLTDTGGSGITLINANGYQTTLEQTKGGFLPSAVGGSSLTYITDYYYQSTSWRVAALGGDADSGADAGFFDWALINASSDDSVSIGSRLCF